MSDPIDDIIEAATRMKNRCLIAEDQWQASFFYPIQHDAAKFLDGTRELRAKISKLMSSNDSVTKAIGMMAMTRYYQITKPIVEKFKDE